MNRLSSARRAAILNLLVEGMSIQGITRAVGVIENQREWSGSSAIRLSPPQIRASGFPALGSSRG